MGKPYVPVFYDWPEVTRELTDAERGRLINAIVLYARGEDPAATLQGNERIVWPMFQAGINRQSEISAARRAARESGWERYKAIQSDTNANKPEQADTTAANNKSKSKNKSNSKSNSNSNVEEISARTRFTPPTPDQVRAYSQEKGLGIDAERFCDYYASKGWKVGQTPMKDWQAAARNWAKRGSWSDSKPNSNPALEFAQRTYTEDELNGLILDMG